GYLGVTAPGFSNLVSPLSLGCWVRPTTSPALGFFAGRWGTHGFLLDQEGSNFRFYIRVSGSNTLTSGGGFGALNAYHHVVGTYLHPQMILYLDAVGSVATTGATAPNPLLPETVAFQLGTSQGFPFAGQLDECWVIGQALSASSVCRICS